MCYFCIILYTQNKISTQLYFQILPNIIVTRFINRSMANKWCTNCLDNGHNFKWIQKLYTARRTTCKLISCCIDVWFMIHYTLLILKNKNLIILLKSQFYYAQSLNFFRTSAEQYVTVTKQSCTVQQVGKCKFWWWYK